MHPLADDVLHVVTHAHGDTAGGSHAIGAECGEPVAKALRNGHVIGPGDR